MFVPYFQLLDLCDAYRLTGISIASQEDSRTCFRCDTFFNGQFQVHKTHPRLFSDLLSVHVHFISCDQGSVWVRVELANFFMVFHSRAKVLLWLLSPCHKPGFLLEAGSRVPAPVYFEQSTRLLIVRN